MDTGTEDRRTIGERYGSATEASSLAVTAERGAADYLIAAGWLRDHLGAMLFRLAREYDGARGAHGIAQAEFDRADQVASALELEGRRFCGPMPRGLGYAERVEAMRRQATAEAFTSRALIMLHLKTLPAVRDALLRIARGELEQAGAAWPEDVIRSVVGSALELYLDPRCPHCQGRGRNGGYGPTPAMRCQACLGSGARDLRSIGKNAAQRELARWLKDDVMRGALGRAGSGIGKALRDPAEVATQDVLSSRQRLQDRLSMLKAAAAQLD